MESIVVRELIILYLITYNVGQVVHEYVKMISIHDIKTIEKFDIL